MKKKQRHSTLFIINRIQELFDLLDTADDNELYCLKARLEELITLVSDGNLLDYDKESRKELRTTISLNLSKLSFKANQSLRTAMQEFLK